MSIITAVKREKKIQWWKLEKITYGSVEIPNILKLCFKYISSSKSRQNLSDCIISRRIWLFIIDFGLLLPKWSKKLLTEQILHNCMFSILNSSHSPLLRLPEKRSIVNFHPQNFAIRRPCLLCKRSNVLRIFISLPESFLLIQLLAFNPGAGEINTETKSNLLPICSTNTDMHSFQGNKG